MQPYPGPGERHLISTGGGLQPAWSRDGRELFYVQSSAAGSVSKLFSVGIETDPAFRAGTPKLLFENGDLATAWGRSYDVSLDGLRFLMTLGKAPSTNLAPSQMIFVQNWFEELKRLVH